MLKVLWDYVYLVRSSIEDWKLTQWESINVEQMDIDCKKFAKVKIGCMEYSEDNSSVILCRLIMNKYLVSCAYEFNIK